MGEPEPHHMATCPYNPSHQVEYYKLHIHLQKCRKQHPNSKKATCPFDTTHIINECELDYHVNYCPKRMFFDRSVYQVGDDPVPVSSIVPEQPQQQLAPGEENWDDDNCGSSYKPELAKKGSHIITKIKGATPSERRKARMEGVKNYRPLDE